MKTYNSDEELYRLAEKRVKDIKGFYWHLFWYLGKTGTASSIYWKPKRHVPTVSLKRLLKRMFLGMNR